MEIDRLGIGKKNYAFSNIRDYIKKMASKNLF